MALSAPASFPFADQVLPGRRVKSAQEPEEAQRIVAEMFCGHDLAVLDARLGMQVRSLQAHDVGLHLLDYRSHVKISPQGLSDFYLVQIPLRSRAWMRVGSTEVESSVTMATLPPIDRECQLEWLPDAAHVIVYVKRSRLERAACSNYGFEDPSKLSLGYGLRLDTDAGQSFLRALWELHDALVETAAAPSAYSLSLLVEMLMVRLLDAADHSLSRSLEQWTSGMPERGRTGASARVYRRFIRELEAVETADLNVADIASRLDVPVRSLQEHVRRESGSTPSALLRDARLLRARAALESADPSRSTVGSVAAAAGFYHQGRFSAEYTRRFGESPTAALQR
ncbi:AraC family transcriptional regulator [Brevibacterium atlanticum]|uniref:AraC family transcriptional regulator n=1 Tax=Brevibacterium atlanticum TaxID=2697563 RepID=UPI0014212315|nr:AraC family transcriptional regulator [Brevibacterium atlanticum]